MVESRSIPWPQLADGKGTAGEIPQLYRVQGTPSFALIDRNGRLFGRLGSAEALERQLPELLARPAGGPAASSRDTWQRPQRLMDLLGLRDGMQVADVGSGEGYFAFHLAVRVGPSGRVYAVDVDEPAITRLRERAEREAIRQVTPVLSTPADPRLPPASLDVALVVDTYHEFTDHEAMLRGIARALKPGGKLAVVDRTGPLGRPRTDYNERHHIPVEVIIEDAGRHGLRLVLYERDFARAPSDRNPFYLVVLEKSAGP